MTAKERRTMATFNVDHIVSKVAERIDHSPGWHWVYGLLPLSQTLAKGKKVTLTFEFKNTKKQEKHWTVGDIFGSLNMDIRQNMKAVIVSNKETHLIESGSIEHEQCLGNDLLASLTTTSSVIEKCTDCDFRLCSAIVLTLSSSHWWQCHHGIPFSFSSVVVTENVQGSLKVSDSVLETSRTGRRGWWWWMLTIRLFTVIVSEEG